MLRSNAFSGFYIVVLGLRTLYIVFVVVSASFFDWHVEPGALFVVGLEVGAFTLYILAVLHAVGGCNAQNRTTLQRLHHQALHLRIAELRQQQASASTACVCGCWSHRP